MLSLYLAYFDDENQKRKFEEIFYAYRKQMIFFAMSILHNEYNSEDVVHNVFLNIAKKNWNVVSGIQSEDDLRNYLLKSVKNASLNFIKSEKRRVSANADFKSEKISDDEFVDKICKKFEYDTVVEAIKELSEKYRYVLYYHFVLETSIAQTAKLLNQSVTTTKKQLVRGKKILLSKLSEKGALENGNEFNHA